MGIYQICSNFAPGVKSGSTPGFTRDMASFQHTYNSGERFRAIWPPCSGNWWTFVNIITLFKKISSGVREKTMQNFSACKSWMSLHFNMRAQWLGGWVLDSRPRGRRFKPHRRHCVVSLSKNINPSLVLVQPRKTRPYLTERLLMGCKE